MSCGSVRTVEANGLRLRGYTWGDPGRSPALLLHSLAAHSHWWDWTAPLLGDGLHLIALDFRGHGQSPWAVPPVYGFDEYVADVLAALDALGLEAPLVIGHSLGGFIGARLAARHPSRVAALVIADMLTGWTDEQARRVREYAARADPEFASAGEAAKRFRLAPPDTRAPAERLLHLGEAGVREPAPGAWTWSFDRKAFVHPAPDPWSFLGAIARPTLVVRGAESTIMSREAAERVAATVRRGRAVQVPNAYHHLMLDDPQGFAAIVGAWLAVAGKGGSP